MSVSKPSSSPLLTRSPSQSNALQISVGSDVLLSGSKSQPSSGSVPSVTSCPFVTPSPSSSASVTVMLTVAVAQTSGFGAV